MRMGRRRGVAAAIIGLLAATVAGCSAGPQTFDDDVPHDADSGGQTFAEMQESLQRIPGLEITAEGGGRPNVKGNTGYVITVELEAGHTLVDGPALVTFLVESAWSVREGWQPNALVTIYLTTADPSSQVDIAAAAAEAGWMEPGASSIATPDKLGTANIDVSTTTGASHRERLGDWPGDVPAVPQGITAGK